MKKLLTVMTINTRGWHTSSPSYPKNDLGWMRFPWEEIPLNWTWFPENSYGKLVIEMKMTAPDPSPRKFEVCLAWQKAVRDGGRQEPITFLKGSDVSDDLQHAWELYESDYFPLPAWDGPVLVWLYGRTVEDAKLDVALWSLATFEEIEDEETLSP